MQDCAMMIDMSLSCDMACELPLLDASDMSVMSELREFPLYTVSDTSEWWGGVNNIHWFSHDL